MFDIFKKEKPDFELGTITVANRGMKKLKLRFSPKKVHCKFIGKEHHTSSCHYDRGDTVRVEAGRHYIQIFWDVKGSREVEWQAET